MVAAMVQELYEGQGFLRLIFFIAPAAVGPRLGWSNSKRTSTSEGMKTAVISSAAHVM